MGKTYLKIKGRLSEIFSKGEYHYPENVHNPYKFSQLTHEIRDVGKELKHMKFNAKISSKRLFEIPLPNI